MSKSTVLGCVYTSPDRYGYPDVSAPDRPSVYTKTIEVYAIRSNTLRYPEVFENDFKGGVMRFWKDDRPFARRTLE